ncbi:hypothetical protein FRC20_005419 [Serendipita sp. 405]|nr:hypothetical protein FRC15_005706 [Serendipita sp. 397]KAG8840775.1 hypothetical protein FRC20_005419 [Serendipita sp. 405]
MLTWTILALALSSASVVQAIGTPLGFGSSTTGGGSAAAATPTSNAQLVSWLSDSTAARVKSSPVAMDMLTSRNRGPSF